MSKATKEDLPCLITPDVLHFNAKNERGSPQVITIFNHHEFAIHYKILSTTPQLYNIGSTQGTISPTSSMEILIELKEDAARLLAKQPQQGSPEGKFKIEVSDAAGTASHKKIIKTTITLARSSSSTVPQLADFVDIDTLNKAYVFLRKTIPFVVGVLVLLLIAPNDNFLLTLKFWLAFFAGLVCMYFYNNIAHN